LCELDFSHIKVAYTADFEVFVDDLCYTYIFGLKIIFGEMKLTVGVFRWVFESIISKKSAAVGTGAIALSPLVDMASLEVKFWRDYVNMPSTDGTVYVTVRNPTALQGSTKQAAKLESRKTLAGSYTNL
jgi:hypothetical protein